MNLFFNPSLNDLYQLICKIKNSRSVHDVVVDYDGEVLIDPQIERPDLVPSKFKFHVQIGEFSKKAITKSSNSLLALFSTLMGTWNGDATSLQLNLQ